MKKKKKDIENEKRTIFSCRKKKEKKDPKKKKIIHKKDKTNLQNSVRKEGLEISVEREKKGGKDKGKYGILSLNSRGKEAPRTRGRTKGNLQKICKKINARER